MFSFFRRKPAIDVQAVFEKAERVFHAYAEFLETNKGGSIQDVSKLPYPKAAILSAAHVLWRVDTRPESRELLKACLFCLADFQSGVGPHDLHPQGVDLSQFDINAMGGPNLVSLMLSNPAGREKYDLFFARANAERQKLMADLEAMR